MCQTPASAHPLFPLLAVLPPQRPQRPAGAPRQPGSAETPLSGPALAAPARLSPAAGEERGAGLRRGSSTTQRPSHPRQRHGRGRRGPDHPLLPLPGGEGT